MYLKIVYGDIYFTIRFEGDKHAIIIFYWINACSMKIFYIYYIAAMLITVSHFLLNFEKVLKKYYMHSTICNNVYSFIHYLCIHGKMVLWCVTYYCVTEYFNLLYITIYIVQRKYFFKISSNSEVNTCFIFLMIYSNGHEQITVWI